MFKIVILEANGIEIWNLKATSSKQKTKNNVGNTDLRFEYNIKEFSVSRKEFRYLYIIKI